MTGMLPRVRHMGLMSRGKRVPVRTGLVTEASGVHRLEMGGRP